MGTKEMDTTPHTPHLPPEIWLMVLDILIPSFFQEDIRRLTVCKQWHSLAIRNLDNRIEYTPRIISRIVHSKSPAMDKTRLRLRESLRSVTIASKSPTYKQEGYREIIYRYRTQSNLIKFYDMLSGFERLKTICFVTRGHTRGRWRGWPKVRRNTLPITSLKPLISGLSSSIFSDGKTPPEYAPWSSITSLDLDLNGTFVEWDNRHTNRHTHLCVILRPLLSRLHTLKIRTEKICPDVLGPLNKGQVYSVRNLRINLHLPVSKVNPKLNTANMCLGETGRVPKRLTTHEYDPLDKSWYTGVLASAMRRAMRRMVSALPVDPRVELVHLAPSGEVHVWNALTDECVRDGTVERIHLGKWLSGEGECFSREGDIS
ncbi:hypothetical protein B0T21DRAFT_349685 [Apiosordaria backusii]|uniref:F-box domain-containing protein n=1 Tax=Apiosordaria backusii TaxID=314023 RepID=A0AA40BEC7_9PEZI|nr:hypothetical protein B0T21DRAFT_349685 [Apiosordaria backusii]